MARLPIDIMTAGNRNELPTGQFSVEKASADTFGGRIAAGQADIGRAISGFADAGMALAAKLNANQKQLQQFGYEDQFVKLQEQDNTDYEQRYRGISGSADGWWQGSRAATKTRMDEWLKTLPEQARAEYQVKADRFIAGRTSQAFKDQFQQQDTNTKQTLKEEQRKAGLQVQQNPLTYEQFVQQQNDLIDKSTLPAAEKAQLKAEARKSLAYTAELSRAQQDPEGVARRPTPTFSPDVNTAIDKAAAANGLDPAMMRRIAQIESGGAPGATTGSYKGLFQMSDAEFAKYGGGNIWSAEDNANAAARKIKAEAADFKAKYGRDPTATDLYMQHQQGVAGYAAHLANPNAPAWQNMLSTGEGQQKGEAWAKAAIWGNIPADIKAQFPGGVDTVTSAAFVNVWRRKVDGYASATIASGALTPEQAAAVQETARRQITAQEQQRAAQYEADQTTKRNQLYIDLKEGTSPEASYRAARQSGLLSDFADIEKAERIIKERNKGEEDYGRGLALMQGGGAVANPYDKDHRDGVQAFYDRAVKGGADPAATAAAVFDRTKIVPQSFATAVRGAMISGDANRVKSGLIAASGMLRDNPNAFAGVEGASDLENGARKYERLSALTGSSDQAVERIMADARRSPEETAATKAMVAHFERTELRLDRVTDRVAGLWSWFGRDQLPPGQFGAAVVDIYKRLAVEGMETLGDKDGALSFAKGEFKKRFGVFNGVVTQYAPKNAKLPSLPGTGDGGFGWISEQAAAVVKDRENVTVDPSQIALVPIERDGVSTRAAFNGQPAVVTRDDSGRPGQRTTFHSVPYMIVVMPKTPEDPVIPVNGAFFPDVDTYVAEKNKKIAADNAAAVGAPMMYFDVTGLGVPVQPYQQKLLETPEQQQRREQQQQRREQAAKAEELLTSLAREHDSREKYQVGADREVQQRQDTIARLADRLKELDTADNQYMAQASRNLIDGEVMRLQGEIMQLQKNAETRKRR